VQPYVGYFDYPLTGLGIGRAADLVEGVTFTVTVYGSVRTYMPTKTSPLKYVSQTGDSGSFAACVRYD
jgi:hypothetical protein